MILKTGLFTSDLFLRAFSFFGSPVYGHQMWIRKKAFVKVAQCSPWNGFILSPDLDDIIETAEEHNCWAVTFTSQKLLDDERLTQLSPSPTPIVFPNFRPDKKLRWSIRKAEQQDFKLKSVSIESAYPLFEDLGRRIKAVIPYGFYEILEDAGYGKTLVLEKNGEVVSALFYIVDVDKLHYMYSLATREEYKPTQATHHLVYSFIKQAFEDKAPYIDLCGCSVPSVYLFKKQFASEIYYRPRYLIVLKPYLWRLVRWKAGMYRDLINHIPDHENWRSKILEDLYKSRIDIRRENAAREDT